MERLRSKITRACAQRAEFRDSSPVFGDGPVPCGLMVIGEAPGRDETRFGRPFVGRAGGFFVAILEESFGMKREGFYITNVVKVWPNLPTKRKKTRKPLKEEEEFFIPFLEEEIKMVAPRVILAVGRTAFSALAPDKDFIPGEWAERDGVPVMPVYHPSYILRKQKSLQESLKALKKSLGKVRRKLEE
ncbi:MAG: uracil-DNA glycosylase [Deltaproteobacteria bacterium]|nr:uracil-DNA glycosylase [Deltaproteobacteria bacterium]